MIGKTLAHYQIVAKIGEGGMGAVFRARDTHLDRDVALKILPRELSGDPERAARFEREARTLATLQHPNIASIYGYEQAEGTRFLVMELVEGEDLAERLARGAMPVDDVVRIAQQIALGLEAAHERGIVHRDLKPANIRIAPDGAVKILDFGLARAYSGEPSQDTDLQTSPTITAAMTHVGMILGTAAYMSPEQARGKAVDRRSDIWSYGVVLCEMLTGKPLFHGETVTDILGAIVRSAPDLSALPANTPPGLRRLIERCLLPDALERLRDIGEARYALAHLDESPPAPHGDTPTARSGRAGWIAAVALLIALAGMTAFWLQRDTSTPVIQASIAMPPGTALYTQGSRGGSMRFSPDGNSIAFVAQAGGQRQIWVRSLDEREARPVSGTEGGHRPFWSPDGKSIGFFHTGTMRRVSARGGAPLTVAAAPDGRGGVWLSDGTIVFAPTPGSGLFAVAAAGGEPRPVTDPGKFSHREPRWLGDGGSFLFLENRSGAQWWICVGNVDGREHIAVVNTGGGGEYSSGHLVYLRGTTLVAQAFDPSSAQVSGEPVPLIETIVRDADYGMGAFSVSSRGGLVYQGGRGSESTIVIFDRKGDRVGAIGDPGSYSQLAWSPDNQTIAVLVDDADGSSDLWMIDAERATRQRFSFTPEGAGIRRSQPTWTPDGRRLYYTFEKDGGTAIYWKRTDGSGGEELLLEIPDKNLWVYDISQDGQWLLFGQEGASSAEDLWAMPLSGEGEPWPVFETPFDEWPGAFSPDGKWLAIDSDEAGRREVFVVPFPGPGGKWQISPAGGRYPRWNKDGSEIFFQDPEGRLMAVPIESSADAITAGEPRELFQSFMITGSTGDFRPDRESERFMILERRIQEAPISLFMNWQASIAER